MYALIIGRTYPDKKTGMMGIFEFEQASALRQNGLETVYAFCDTRSIKTLRKCGYVNLIKDNVPVFGYHLPIGGSPKKVFNTIKTWYYKKLLEKIIKEKGLPQIIHIHFPLLTLNNEVWDILKSFNIPIIVTEHWTKVQKKEISIYLNDLLKRIVDEADSFICVGEPLKKSVLELTSSEKDIKVIPNMVSNLFYYDKEKKINSHFQFVVVGRLVEVKRVNFVIDAFTKAFKNNDDVHLTIVGGGPLFNNLKTQISELNMSNRIKLCGFLSREETGDIIRESHVYVSGSKLETFGVPFIEAMACGKPVIGAKNGPIDPYIDSSNGVLYDSNSIDDLIKALSFVYNNKELYNGKQISEKANVLFSTEAVSSQLKKIYNHCINNYTK